MPLFVFMRVALEKSSLAEELLETMALLFGRLRGGIAISVVVVGAIPAASTGIVGASVITMGMISLPTMLRRGVAPDDRRLERLRRPACPGDQAAARRVPPSARRVM